MALVVHQACIILNSVANVKSASFGNVAIRRYQQHKGIECTDGHIRLTSIFATDTNYIC